MIFQTMEDVQDFLPFAKAFTFDQIKPFLLQAEEDLLIKTIGQAIYDEIDTVINTGTPSEDQEKLIAKMRAPAVHYAVSKWLPFGQVIISDAGIQIANTDSMKTAFQWQIDKLDESAMNSAFENLDKLLAFLETNRATYTTWANDAASTIYKDCFISTTAKLNELFPAIGNSRRNFLFLKSALYKIEDFKILPLIGEAYFNELKTQFAAETLTTANTKVVKLIQKAMAPLAIHKGLMDMSVMITDLGLLQFNNKGVSNTTQTKEPAADSRIKRIQEEAKLDGETYLAMIRTFIDGNITDYPTYSASSAYTPDDSSTITHDPDGDYFAGI